MIRSSVTSVSQVCPGLPRAETGGLGQVRGHCGGFRVVPVVLPLPALCWSAQTRKLFRFVLRRGKEGTHAREGRRHRRPAKQRQRRGSAPGEDKQTESPRLPFWPRRPSLRSSERPLAWFPLESRGVRRLLHLFFFFLLSPLLRLICGLRVFAQGRFAGCGRVTAHTLLLPAFKGKGPFCDAKLTCSTFRKG